MALLFRSLNGLMLSTAFAPDTRVTVNIGGEFFNAHMSDLQGYFNAPVVDQLNQISLSAGRWAVARTLTLDGPVTGSVAMDGSQNVTLTTSIADGSLTIGKIGGLETRLSVIESSLEDLEEATGSLNPTYALADHAHVSPLAEVFSAELAGLKQGVNSTALQGSAFAQYGDVGLVARADGAATMLTVGNDGRVAAHISNGDSVQTFELYTNSNLNLHDYQTRLDRQEFLNLGQGLTGTGVVGYGFFDNNLETARFVRARGINGALTLTQTGQGDIEINGGGSLTRNGYQIFHTGNLDVTALLRTGDGIREAMAGTPATGVDPNTDGPGRFDYAATRPHLPGAGAWSILSYATTTGQVQQAVSASSGEMWYRVKLGSDWSLWRRSWDSENFNPLSYLTTGAFGLGDRAISGDPDDDAPTGFYHNSGTSTPLGGSSFLFVNLFGGDERAQLATGSDTLLFRNKSGSTQGDWHEVYHSGNTHGHGIADVDGLQAVLDGMVDKDSLIRALPSTDLNAVVEEGAYQSASGAGQNFPVAVPGRLDVRVVDGLVLQTYRAANLTFDRSRVDGQWTGWRQAWDSLALTDDSIWRQRVAPAASTDVNTLRVPGAYPRPAGLTLGNLPSADPGILLVDAVGDFVRQLYVRSLDGRTWERSFNATTATWCGWIRAATLTTEGNMVVDGTVSAGSFHIVSPAGAVVEWALVTQDTASAKTGIIYEQDSVGLEVYEKNGAVSNRLMVNANGTVTFNGGLVYHEGNFNADDKLDADGTAIAAERLATAHLINGVPFDGSQDITIDVGNPGVFEFVQATPSDLWVIEHELGYRPSVTTMDADFSLIEGFVRHPNVNRTEIAYSEPVAGFATLS